ncbi:MAG TPA: LamG domain-containing protein [Candidatus Paceibacterota bacterium]
MQYIKPKTASKVSKYRSIPVSISIGFIFLVSISILISTNIASIVSAFTIQKTLPTQPDLQNGLVGHWTFDGKDISGTSATDRSGNNNTGTLTNGPLATVGKIGQALNFDGSDDYVSIADNNSLDLTSAVTISLWFKADGWTAAYQGLVAKRIGNSSNYGLNVSSTGSAFQWFFHDGDYQIVDINASTVSTGQWHHFVGTFSDTGDVVGSIYIDGTLKKTETFTARNLVANTNTLRIGESNNPASGPEHFNGSVDDVRVYSRALSAAEITKLYKLGATSHVNVTLPTQPDLQSGLVGHWTFDGKDMGPNVLDKSGNANHGNAVYGTTGNTSTTTVAGRIGQALVFDGFPVLNGLADSVLLPGVSVTGTSHSVSMWLNVTGLPADTYGTLFSDAFGNTGLYYYNDGATEKITYFYSLADNFASTTIKVDNKWHHFAAVSGTGGVTFYVDGVRSGAVFGQVPDYSATRIGGDIFNDEFKGALDDIRLYNRPLSAAEVTKLYKLGATSHVNTTLRTQPDLQNGLVGHWTFDGKDVGPNVLDKSGNANHGNAVYGTTGNTSTTTVPGRIGQALSFDGVNDYVLVNNSASLTMTTGDISMGGWLYRNASFSVNPNIFHKKSGTNDINSGYAMGVLRSTHSLGGHKPAFSFADGTNAAYFYPTSITYATPFRKWVHAFVVFNSTTDTAQIYINGQPVDTTNVYASAIGSVTNTTAPNIGRISTSYFGGNIDDYRVYSRALSAGEVRKLYEMGR